MRGRNAFQSVGPFTERDVGCRPIFHSGLKGGYARSKGTELQSFLLIKRLNEHVLGLILPQESTVIIVQMAALLIALLGCEFLELNGAQKEECFLFISLRRHFFS